jgi:hypothetical protein
MRRLLLTVALLPFSVANAQSAYPTDGASLLKQLQRGQDFPISAEGLTDLAGVASARGFVMGVAATRGCRDADSERLLAEVRAYLEKHARELHRPAVELVTAAVDGAC